MFEVRYETTPNPQSLKFILNKKISDEIIEFKDHQSALRSPLALKILGFPWAKSVFLGENFVTITKEDWLDWETIQEPLLDLIQEHFNQGEKALLEKKEDRNLTKTNETEDVKKIKDILKKDIQPAVAMDGGYIEFVSYEKGIVYLSLQGACSGCPSSTITLKEGIEARLRQFVPEIKEVVSV
ncbi:MAG: NifU family protein [Bdellovibrionales bacterium]|nr:NifU family protein [Bdellovibrionales bacterium]